MSRLREYQTQRTKTVWPSAGDFSRQERRSTLYSPDGSVLCQETPEGTALQVALSKYDGPWAGHIGSTGLTVEVKYDNGYAWENTHTYAAAQYESGAFAWSNLLGTGAALVATIPAALGTYAVCLDVRWDGAEIAHAAPYPLAELVVYEYASWASMSPAGASTNYHTTEATVPATVVGRQIIPLGVAYCDGIRCTAWHQMQYGPVVLRPPKRWTYNATAGRLTFYALRSDTLALAAYSKDFASHPVAGVSLFLHYLGVSPWWELATSGTPGGADRLIGKFCTNAAGRLEYILDYWEVGTP